ncbi:hypothetical protein ACPB9E_06630 [Streptomyces exfoliatus]|uniref:hypothetical protein n=1 Tax=Streptomyces exfoliatus TaxID=1905 RepID=UPI003C2E8967
MSRRSVLGAGAHGTAPAASAPGGSTADDQWVLRTLAQRGGRTGPVEGAVDVNGWQVCSSRTAATAPRARRTAYSARTAGPAARAARAARATRA